MSGNGSWLTVPLRERDGQGRKGRRGAGWRALQANRPAESGTGFFGTQAEPGGEASDDRQTEQAPVVDPAMPAAGALSLVAVLSAGTRQYGGSGADGADRRQFLETPYYGSRKIGCVARAMSSTASGSA